MGVGVSQPVSQDREVTGSTRTAFERRKPFLVMFCSWHGMTMAMVLLMVMLEWNN